MSRPCSICNHEKRAEIDGLLVDNESFESIASRFEGFSASALQRHRANHLFKAVRESRRARDLVRSDTILDRVELLIERTERICTRCERRGDDRTNISAIREISRNLELLARLRGELKEQLTFNCYVNPSWLQLRAVIINGLDEYPEARERLLKGLERVEPPPMPEVGEAAHE